jgi:hypothetical protein
MGTSARTQGLRNSEPIGRKTIYEPAVERHCDRIVALSPCLARIIRLVQLEPRSCLESTSAQRATDSPEGDNEPIPGRFQKTYDFVQMALK